MKIWKVKGKMGANTDSSPGYHGQFLLPGKLPSEEVRGHWAPNRLWAQGYTVQNTIQCRSFANMFELSLTSMQLLFNKKYQDAVH